jgi:hypothetical protein
MLLKPRKISSIVEYSVSLVIYIILYPIFNLAKSKFKEVRHPEVISINEASSNLPTFLFALNLNPILRAIPDTSEMKNFADKYFSDPKITFFGEIRSSTFPNVQFKYANNKDQVREDLKNSASNGFGIEVVNIGELNWHLSPKVFVYYQYDSVQ